MPSPIDLEEFTVLEIILPLCRPAEIAVDFIRFQVTFTLDFELRKNEKDPGKWQILQTVLIDFGENNEPSQKGSISILGQFVFPENTSEDQKVNLLLFNGNAILYGALRGVFATITGTFHTGVIHLPTINIHEIVQAKITAAQNNQKPPSKKPPASSSPTRTPAKKRVKAP